MTRSNTRAGAPRDDTAHGATACLGERYSRYDHADTIAVTNRSVLRFTRRNAAAVRLLDLAGWESNHLAEPEAEGRNVGSACRRPTCPQGGSDRFLRP